MHAWYRPPLPKASPLPANVTVSLRFSVARTAVILAPVDTAAAEHYAVIASSRERAGKPIAGFDALIAAVCRSHGAALATRSVSDFDGTGIEVIDPWHK